MSKGATKTWQAFPLRREARGWKSLVSMNWRPRSGAGLIDLDRPPMSSQRSLSGQVR